MAAHQCFACKLPIHNGTEYRLPCGEYRHTGWFGLETEAQENVHRQATRDHYAKCAVCAPWSKRFDDAIATYHAARDRKAPKEELNALAANLDAIDRERGQ
jgi:hypothetical protein